FVIEDNAWGISVPRTASTSVPSNAVRAAAYGMPGIRVEDNDVDAVHAAAETAVARARRGEGPSLIEVATLRMLGHFEGDAQGYRSELDSVADLDPIPRYAERLRSAGVLDEVTEQRIRSRASTRVEDAVTFAKESPVPDPAEVHRYVFAEEQS
ncbi:MAG: thiamine pyrophosphate-dependent enzyme, partial [Actinomycetales bacterium]